MTENDVFTLGPDTGRNIAECNEACGGLSAGARISSAGSCLPVDTECEQRVAIKEGWSGAQTRTVRYRCLCAPTSVTSSYLDGRRLAATGATGAAAGASAETAETPADAPRAHPPAARRRACLGRIRIHDAERNTAAFDPRENLWRACTATLSRRLRADH